MSDPIEQLAQRRAEEAADMAAWRGMAPADRVGFVDSLLEDGTDGPALWAARRALAAPTPATPWQVEAARRRAQQAEESAQQQVRQRRARRRRKVAQ